MDEMQARLARNEQMLKMVNEQIQESNESARHPVAGFVCECGESECAETIELALTTYREVHAQPLQFVVKPGHEIPMIEDVVTRGDGYIVIRKRGEGGPFSVDSQQA